MRRRRVGVLIAAGLAGTLLAAWAGWRAASASALTADSGAFVVCFAPPRIDVPPAGVQARVAHFDAELDRVLAPSDDPVWRAFVRAIITHESGGDPLAVSPTGCAGAAAISAPPAGFVPCCEIDAGDDYRDGYDRCNSELRVGFRCPPDDPRFTAAYAVEFAVDRLRRIHQVMAAEAAGGPAADPRLVVPLAWNAGLGVFHPFAVAMRSPDAALARLDFAGKTPYTAFRVRGHATKIVEIYDYLAWFRFLAEYWERGTPGAPPVADLVCVDYRGGANRAVAIPPGRRAALIRRLAVATDIRRLAFGTYEPATAYVAAGPLRPLLWWLADSLD